MHILIATFVFVAAGAKAFDFLANDSFGQLQGSCSGGNYQIVLNVDKEGNLDSYLPNFLDPEAENTNQNDTYLIGLPHADKQMHSTTTTDNWEFNAIQKFGIAIICGTLTLFFFVSAKHATPPTIQKKNAQLKSTTSKTHVYGGKYKTTYRRVMYFGEKK